MPLRLTQLKMLDPALQRRALERRLAHHSSEPGVLAEVRRVAEALGLWDELARAHPDLFESIAPLAVQTSPGVTPTVFRDQIPSVEELHELIGQKVILRCEGKNGRPEVVAGTLAEVRYHLPRNTSFQPGYRLRLSPMDESAARAALRPGERVLLSTCGGHLMHYSLTGVEVATRPDPTLSPAVEAGDAAPHLAQLARQWISGKPIPEAPLPPEAFLDGQPIFLGRDEETGEWLTARVAPKALRPEAEVAVNLEKNALFAVMIDEIFRKAFDPDEVQALREGLLRVSAESVPERTVLGTLHRHVERHIHGAFNSWNGDARFSQVVGRARVLMEASGASSVETVRDRVQVGTNTAFNVLEMLTGAIGPLYQHKHGTVASPEQRLSILGNSTPLIREMASAGLDAFRNVNFKLTDAGTEAFTLKDNERGDCLAFDDGFVHKFRALHGFWLDTRSPGTTGCPARVAFQGQDTAIDKLLSAYAELIRTVEETKRSALEPSLA